MAWLMHVDLFVTMQSFSHGTATNIFLVIYKKYYFYWKFASTTSHDCDFYEPSPCIQLLKKKKKELVLTGLDILF